MAENKALIWDASGEHTYTTGIDHVALYLQEDDGTYPNGVAWNGVTTVTDSPSGAEANDIYADNIKYLSIRSAEDFGLTIECYDTPDEFDQCDGFATPENVKGLRVSQQTRRTFGLCYRSKLGNDIKGDDYGYELHMVYGCTAAPSEVSHNTINDSPEPGTLSYEIDTIPVPVPNMKNSSHLVIDSTTADPKKLAALEKILYGSENAAARLPLPTEIINTILKDSE